VQRKPDYDELSDYDLEALKGLAQRILALAEMLDKNGPAEMPDGIFDAKSPSPPHILDDVAIKLARRTRVPLPESRLVRRIIRHRQLRNQHFGNGLFSDPAWDMLLDLAAARSEYKRVSVTSLCVASGVPQTSALRCLGELVGAGFVQRTRDATDRRRIFVELTDKAAMAMANYFQQIGDDSPTVI